MTKAHKKIAKNNNKMTIHIKKLLKPWNCNKVFKYYKAEDCWYSYSPNIALMDPAISTASEPLYIWTSMMPDRMVSLTLAPKSMAPTVSNTVAKTHAWRRVTTPEPTAVPNELATSLAPTENARMKAMMKPSTSSQRKSDISVCVAIVSMVTVARDASVVDSIAATLL